MKYFMVSVVIALVTYGQLMIKHRVNLLGPSPDAHEWPAVAAYVLRALGDWGILSGLLAAAAAAMAWLVTLSRFELSAVYPLLAVNFLVVPLVSIPLFGERMNWLKGIGLLVVVIGLVVFGSGLERPAAK